MCMDGDLSKSPDWDQLYETVAAQEGLFTTRQAAEAGYSAQLLAHHVRGGRLVRIRRGVYRVIHFPAGEHEELVTLWLWSKLEGVFSNESALALHELSDALPAQVHLTLPVEWRRRRFRVPDGVVLHHAEIASKDRSWAGAVPVTSIRRTLSDCARGGLSPELLRQAAQQALRRGLAVRDELTDVEHALEPFGGLAE